MSHQSSVLPSFLPRIATYTCGCDGGGIAYAGGNLHNDIIFSLWARDKFNMPLNKMKKNSFWGWMKS